MAESHMGRELYRVVITWEDVEGRREWDERLDRHVRRNDQNGFDEPLPERKRLTKYVAVLPGFGGDPVGAAGDLAVRTVVGGPECWETFLPAVESVEHVASCVVEVDRG